MNTFPRPTCAASLQFGVCACWRMAAPLRADYLASGSGPSEKPTPIAETRNLIGGGSRKTAEGATRLSFCASCCTPSPRREKCQRVRSPGVTPGCKKKVGNDSDLASEQVESWSFVAVGPGDTGQPTRGCCCWLRCVSEAHPLMASWSRVQPTRLSFFASPTSSLRSSTKHPTCCCNLFNSEP